MSLLHGLQRDANGALQIQDGALSITRVMQSGLQVSQAGELIVQFVPAAPSNTIVRSGILFSSDGSLYVSTAAAQTIEKGIGYRTSRALCVTFDAPANSAIYATLPDVGRVLVNTAGAVHVGGLSFVLDFPDAGSGAVTTTPVTANTGISATFTRAGATATTIGSTGLVIKAIGANVPRSYYDPTSLAYLGYLAEGSRVNLALESETFGAASWTVTRSTISANAATAPDGTVTADKLVEDATATNTHTVTQTFAKAASAVTYAVSVFAKQAGRTWVALQGNDTSNAATAYFNIGTGVVGSTTANGTYAVVSSSIKSYPNGWYRCTFVYTSPATAADNLIIYLATADNTVTYSGDASSGVHLWGAQKEAASFESTYIPTVGATVTRNADALTYNFSGGTAGTLFIAGTVPSLAAQQRLWTLYTDANNRLSGFIAVTSGIPSYIVVDGAVVQVPSIGSGSTTANTAFKFASAWATNDFSISGNGAAVATDNSGTVPATTTLGIGMGPSDNGSASISRTSVYAVRLSNAFLQQLTT